MAKLPFVVEPRRKPILEKIGSESSGIIEVERRGYLTTGEKAFVQQVQQFDNGTTEIVTVSRRVARKYSLGMDRAYNIVVGIISGSTSPNEDIELVSSIEEEFAEEMTAVVKGLAAGQVREELVLAACILKYRVDNDFSIEEINNVHPDIIEGLAALYRDEDKRSLEAFKEESINKEEATVNSIEEAEKKPEKATRSRSKTTTGD
jgi:hypothetical protein